MLTELQCLTAQAIVNIFETGRPEGRYGEVVAKDNDPGHLTYGRSQTTLITGNLALLIGAYCATPGAALAAELREYLPRLKQRDITLDRDARLQRLLRAAGDDAVMRAVQDRFFDRVYFRPACMLAERIGITTALGTTVIYDSCIHGSFGLIQKRVTCSARADERAWVREYVQRRRAWLAGHVNRLLQHTVYRMDTFAQLIAAGSWDLALPLQVRGFELDEASLLGRGASAHDADEEVNLALSDPPLTGPRVEALQAALLEAGCPVAKSGTLDAQTDAAIRSFQQRAGLFVDGVVGPATRAALGL